MKQEIILLSCYLEIPHNVTKESYYLLGELMMGLEKAKLKKSLNHSKIGRPLTMQLLNALTQQVRILVPIFVCFMYFHFPVNNNSSKHTGWIKGAAVLIEKKLERPLLWLPCRHHIAELLVGAAWTKIFGDIDKSPYIQKFKDFKQIWDTLDKTKYLLLLIFHYFKLINQFHFSGTNF